MKKNLIKSIQNFAHKNDLWKKGDKIVVGVSGGADSACLLDILAKIAPKYDLQLVVAHINYGLRGKDSDNDENFVKKLAEKYNIAIEILPSVQFSEILRLSLRKTAPSENELRKIRYDFFEKVRKGLKFDLIAVAHNQNDQAETVLMRIIRGSGLQGVSAIRPKSGKVIRPLLSTARKEILEFLKEKKLKHRTDKTNLEPLYLRNRIRLELLPYLEKSFNPKIQKSLAALAEISADDFDVIDKFSQKKCKVVFDKKEKCINLEIKKLLDLHPSILRQYLRRSVIALKGDLANIELGHIEEIIRIVRSTKNKSQAMTFGGLKLERKGAILKLCFQNKK